VLKPGDTLKHKESGKVFTVKSVSSSLIILATKDESHSMLVNPSSIESLFLPVIDEEVKKNLKS
jgi:hypothetical protein